MPFIKKEFYCSAQDFKNIFLFLILHAKEDMESSSKKIAIKREATFPLFHEEHHNNIRLSWKIRKGVDKGVSIKRIKKYTDWFFVNYLQIHFEQEEEYAYPILGKKHKLVKKSLSDHRRLRRLFKEEKDIEKSIHHIEEELERHIRFEERELFPLIQQKATKEELRRVHKFHRELKFEENTDDKFWED